MTNAEDSPQARNMKSSDLAQIAELHRNCFPESISIFSVLSDNIVKCFYAQMLEEAECVVTVLEEPVSGCIIGLAFGTTRPGFQRRFLRQHFFQFGLSVFNGLLTGTALWKMLWDRLLKKIGTSSTKRDSVLADADVPAPKDPEAFFALVGVHAKWRGGGNAERLVKYFTSQMFAAAAARIRGTVRSDNLASLILFKRLGWKSRKISDTQVSIWIDRTGSDY